MKRCQILLCTYCHCFFRLDRQTAVGLQVVARRRHCVPHLLRHAHHLCMWKRLVKSLILLANHRVVLYNALDTHWAAWYFGCVLYKRSGLRLNTIPSGQKATWPTRQICRVGPPDSSPGHDIETEGGNLIAFPVLRGASKMGWVLIYGLA